MLEAKRPEKDRFSSQKWWTSWCTNQPAQSTRTPVDRLLLPSLGPVENCKKPSLYSSSLSFPVKGYAFPIDVQSRIMITCQTLNAPTASEPIEVTFWHFGFRGYKPINWEFHFIYEEENTYICLFTYLFLP